MKKLIFLIALAALACANRESTLVQTEPIQPCSCDGKPLFKVLKVQQVVNSNFVNIFFGSCEAYQVKWEIVKDSRVLLSGTVRPITSAVGAYLGTLSEGNYIARLSGINCSGKSEISFHFSPINENKSLSKQTFAVYDSYPNFFENVAFENQTDTYSPEKFPATQIALAPDSLMGGLPTPTFGVIYDKPVDVFLKKGLDHRSRGIYVSLVRPDYRPCHEYFPNLQFDAPCISASGKNITYEEFLSTIEPSRRGFFAYPPKGNNEEGEQFFLNQPEQKLYESGLDYHGAFGRGDAIGGRAQVMFQTMDTELNLVNGPDNKSKNKYMAFLKGIGDATTGYALIMYSNTFPGVGRFQKERYPLNKSDYANIRENPIWTEKGDVEPIKGWRLSDNPRIVETEELAFYAEDGYNQNLVLKNKEGHPQRTINHFGSNANAGHPLAKVIHFVETGAYRAHLDGRKYCSQAKIIADGVSPSNNTSGGYLYNDYVGYDPQGFGAFLPRHLAFMQGMMIFFSGADYWNIWDRPKEGLNQDAYNGTIGALTYLGAKVKLSKSYYSLLELRPSLTFTLWNTEVSYNSGQTWQKHKGIDFKDTSTILPLRIGYTSDGKIAVFACRPYGVEPLNCQWRVKINNRWITGQITEKDWKSCYPEQKERKDFYLKIQ
ncbi:hypothetical protein QM480_23785 [Flectobacillus sp. DC10W]|jgi:hypothetical protein|uniref:Uncharacterized protein n=1 Tax=Flectobacillus longus TaxID=2984207 RepID=A0ABT6YV23_9BACT|nr:hypothetical protein [Flectobacillus longus]MDI9867385.1 hypothetical protein [Flectobacillus longus]